MDKLHVDYAQYHRLIDQVVHAVECADFQPDLILGVSRGGLFLADGLSRALRKPMAVIAASSYRDSGGTAQGELQISSTIASVVPVAGKVLLVDDLAGLSVPLVVTSSHQGQDLHRSPLPTPCAWVMGHEGQGVSPALVARAALSVRIPQPGGEESLNVAAAAAICLYASIAQP